MNAIRTRAIQIATAERHAVLAAYEMYRYQRRDRLAFQRWQRAVKLSVVISELHQRANG